MIALKTSALVMALVAGFCTPAYPADTTATAVGMAPEATTGSGLLILDFARKTQLDYWDDAVTKFRAMETSAPRHATLILGDSITAGWPEGLFPAKVVNNRGLGGDFIGSWKYPGVVDRLDTSLVILQPHEVFLMIGVNDCLDIGPPMEILVAGYARLLDELKRQAPAARIIVQSVLPIRGKGREYMTPKIKELNGHIERMAKERGLTFVDLYPVFAEPSGEMKQDLTSDGIHLSPAGYQLWRDTLIEKGLGEK